MASSTVLGGAIYSLYNYYQIGMIIAGTTILSMGKGKGRKSQSIPMRLMFI